MQIDKTGKQLTMEEITPEYKQFVEKFKPKKTTDDCHTPDNIFSAVVQWVVSEYGIDEGKIVRPFWPGGDYERFEYPEGCIVLDNPPFSILAKIIKFYEKYRIDYFLFAPTLTAFNAKAKSTIFTGVQITYENKAKVNTSFVTNIDDSCIRSAPSLRKVIEEANRDNEKTRTLPKYEYPDNVITGTMVEKLARSGVDFRVDPKDCVRISRIDAQKGTGKTIFGGGFLLSEKAAAEKVAAEEAAEAAAKPAAKRKWELSDREKAIIAELGRKE